MFTGIVETTGAVRKFERGKLVVSHPFAKADLHVGQSVSVNGCCLTIVAFDREMLTFDLSPETIARTSFAALGSGGLVNLERGMRLGDALDGHLVTGHIDGVGVVRRIEPMDLGAKCVWFDPRGGDLRWLVEKGSVAVDGISLTVNQVDAKGFSVALIPHTLMITNFRDLREGGLVNLEFDLLAKYVERLLTGRAATLNAGAAR